MLPAASKPPIRPALPAGPYLVAGLGKAGSAASAALERRVGARDLVVWDGSNAPHVERERRRLAARGITALDGDGLAAFERPRPPRCVVKSPGMPPDLPLLRAAREHGAEVMDELELGWRLTPARVLAVTGTNGKSTTSALALALLRAAGLDAAPAGNSESAPPLSAFALAAPPWLVCEVSSYQLQSCPALLPEVAVFTNLTRDHLERHGTMEAYAACKRRLFVRGERAVPLAVVNVDDEIGRRLAAEVGERGGKVLSYGAARDAADRVTACEWGVREGTVTIATPAGPLELHTRLPGPQNALNLAAAVALSGLLGLDAATTHAALESFEPVPGRFESIESGQPFDVVVDFALNPDAVAQAGRTARAVVDERPGARLIMVTSTSGLYDPGKRPLIGQAAAEAADHLFLTTGNRFGEEHESILGSLLEGARSVPGASFETEPDRRAAIAAAIADARPGDLVLVTGRGAQRTLYEGRDLSGAPFDDRAVARELLAELPAAVPRPVA